MPKKTNPKKLYRVFRVEVKFNEVEIEKLGRMAEEEGISMSSLIRLCVQKFYREKHSNGELPTLI